jgi:hypothetical protein
MKEYLISSLGVDSDRIVTLIDEKATREAIVTELKSLATKDEIKENDPILFFYAGHGSQIQSPFNPTTELIEMRLPYDFCKAGSSTMKGQGIWDFTLRNLLSRIAGSKGDNIVSIITISW